MSAPTSPRSSDQRRRDRSRSPDDRGSRGYRERPRSSSADRRDRDIRDRDIRDRDRDYGSEDRSRRRDFRGGGGGGGRGDRGGGGGGSGGHRNVEVPPDAFTMQLEGPEVAFVLGRNGVTKNKIARAAGARLDMNDDGVLVIHGSESVKERAREYVSYVIEQRTDTVKIDFEAQRPDLSSVEVPRECVGFVTGRGGKVLRSFEEEWGTLMFFAKSKHHGQNAAGSGRDGGGGGERLAIFGTIR
eukprot:UC1_evm1s825